MQNKNLINYIVSFLTLKEISNLSQVNKKFYLTLDNENNEKINNLWREECNKTFYKEENESMNLDEINKKDKGIEFNWRQIYKNFIIYKQQISNEIALDIYEILKIHCYLPKIRKHIPYIESDFSSEHQKHFYDIIKEENKIYLYYNLYFEDNKNKKLMKPNLPFANYILNFTYYLEQIKEKKTDFIALDKIFNYSNIEINPEKISSEPLKFIIWLKQVISLYCKLHLGYIYKFENENENKRFLNEFINRHNSLIDVALYLNDKYEHINITINYLYSNLYRLTKTNGKFSLYNMILSIWYKEVYLNLENEINEKLSCIIDNLFIELNSSDYDLTTDSTLNYCSNDEEEENKDNKSLVENIGNIILDFCIGEFNSTFIKHTELNINEHYENYEKILGKKTSNYIINKIQEGENFSNLKYLISFQENNDLDFSLDDEKQFKIIPRTQLYLMNQTLFSIKNFIVKELNEKYFKFINNYDEINNEMEIELENQLNIKNENVKKELDNIKNYLKSLSEKNNIKEEKINMLINQFMIKDGKKIIDLAIKISSFYYNEIKKYNESNKLIETFLDKNKRITQKSAFMDFEKENEEIKKTTNIIFENKNVMLNI